MVKSGPEFNKRLPRFLRNEDIPTDTFTPRTYQVELLDAALQRNTIICLGSNSGKMFIALMVIKELSHQIRHAIKDGGKRTVFLVVSDALADTEWQIIQHHTDLTVGKYTSDTKLETWSEDQWQKELEDKQILVMVTDVFRTALENKLLPVSCLNLVVFDDCHLAVGDHDYVHITKLLKSNSDSKSPHILGLTAAVLSNRYHDPELLRETVTSLETTLNSRAETSMLVISERYGSRPKELLFQCESKEALEVTIQLKQILENALDFLYELQFTEEECGGKRDPRNVPKNALSECHNILMRLGPWCAARIADMMMTQIEKSEKSETNPLFKRLFRYACTQLRYFVKIFEKHFDPDYVVDQFLEYTTPKVIKLVDILRAYKPDLDFMIISNDDDVLSDESDMSDDSMDLSDSDEEEGSPGSRSHKQIHIAVKRVPENSGETVVSSFLGSDEKKLTGIVFVEQRYVAFALNKLIEEVCGWDENLCFIKSNHLTGLGGKEGKIKKVSGRSNRKQEETLRKFRMQELNLLVSTSVLEEGVDVPKCNLVVRFDPPRDYKSYTLSKGRARARDAEYTILMESDQKDTFLGELKLFKGIEEVLIGDGRGRKDLADDDDDVDPNIEVEMLPPYRPANELFSPMVTMETAIALVNRYCAKLPSDAFTHLTPHCSVSPVPDAVDPPLFIASLRLPVNSSIKQMITGVQMPSKKLAKMAVALKMCEMLHKAGELDENLMPVGKEMFVYEEEEEWEEEDLTGQARPGTTKRKQYYYKKVADAFVNSHVSAKEACFLYFINLKLTGPITDEQNTRGRRIYSPEETTQSLGILSSKEIPLVPLFPVYTRSGEVTVSVDLICSGVKLCKDELERLKHFHQFLFTSVLHLEKDPMEFSLMGADVGYLIVPLDRDTESTDLGIHWDFVDLVQSSMKPEKKNVFDKKRDVFEFKKENFSDAVVMPSYRNIDQPQHFYVAEIRLDLNPLSPFPSPELYKTFNEYYTTKYGLVITNPEQPLLDVDHTSARLNLLTPRYMNQKGVALPTSSAETKRARRENLQQKQILVPELCDIHVFPASLWRKAVCLPAVLYRMNYLMLAEEIRKRIACETGIGVVGLPLDFQFPQLDFGFETNPEKLKTEESQDKDEESGTSQPGAQLDTDSNVQSSQQQPSTGGSSELPGDGEMSSDSDSGIASTGSEVSVVDAGSQEKNVSSGESKGCSTKPACCSDQPVIDVNGTMATAVSCEENIASTSEGGLMEDCCVNKVNNQVTNPEFKSAHDNSNSPDQGNSTVIDRCTRKSKASSSVLSSSMQVLPKENLSCHNVQPLSESSSQCDSQADATEIDTSRCSTSLNCNAKDNSDASSQSGSAALVRPAKCATSSKEDDLVLNSCPSLGTSHTSGIIEKSNEWCSLSKTYAHSNMEISNATSDDPGHDSQTTDNSSLVKSAESVPTPSENETQVCLQDQAACEKELAQLSEISDNTASNPVDSPKAESIHTTANVLQSHDHVEIRDHVEASSSEAVVQVSGWDETFPEDKSPSSDKADATQAPVSQNNCDVDFGVWANPSSCRRVSESDTSSISDNVEVDLSSHPSISLDEDRDLNTFVGPSPCLILQALTMSNANDFFSLERLETIGDSFLKCAITVYLYCSYPGIHEGKLSYLRSKQVSNYNLYRLGRKKRLAECMVSAKFEPYENWLPPGYIINENRRRGPVPKVVIANSGKKLGTSCRRTDVDANGDKSKLDTGNSDKLASCLALNGMQKKDIQCTDVEKEEETCNKRLFCEENEGGVDEIGQGFNTDLTGSTSGSDILTATTDVERQKFDQELEEIDQIQEADKIEDLTDISQTMVPYNLQTQHGIPDKSVADCVEALIGCYLTTCGKKAALMFMSWLGLKVLPRKDRAGQVERKSGQQVSEYEFEELQCPPSPLLLTGHDDPGEMLRHLLDGYSVFEEKIGYTFQDRSYLLQAFTHASYHYNTITDCYQRLEFLGDAILDYVITRHLYEDSKKYSPGILTDLRSALVNNNIFAALAVKWDFHKFFKSISPALFHVIEKFVARQKEKEDEIDIEDEHELEDDDDDDDEEHEEMEMEIPKALGDIFESVAGAIYLDSGMSLDTVWRVYYRIMRPQIEKYLKSIPKSPVRELLELEPETAKFEKPERTVDGKIRVTVNVVGKGVFSGIGRNYRIAKSAAAKKALRIIRSMQMDLV